MATIEELVSLVGATASRGSLDAVVKRVQLDSRRVRPGDLFVAVRGQHESGADYVMQAIERGAVAVMTDLPLAGQTKTVAWLQVAEPRLALAQAACAVAGNPSHELDVIGITGTNGKTSVAFITQAMLRAAGRVPGLIGSVRHEVRERRIPAERTTPEAPVLQDLLRQMVDAGCDSAVMEASSHALQQHRCSQVRYRVGLFTNLSPEHLDYHESMDAYFAAKRRLFSCVAASGHDGTMIVNIDDEWGEKLLPLLPQGPRVLRYGARAGADVRASGIELATDGLTFDLETPWGATQLTAPLIGQINVSNTLAACAAAGALGVTVDQMQQGLASMPPIPGRLEKVSDPDSDVNVFVDYAHTEDALRNALQTLRRVARQRLIVVFGCGGDRDQGKRPAMGRVAAELADVVVLTSDNPRSEDPAEILRHIREGAGSAGQLVLEEGRRNAIVQAIELAQPGDLVLIAGKGHETYQEFSSTVTPFDDREVARGVLQGHG